MMGQKYDEYDEALKYLRKKNIWKEKKLSERRKKLSLSFAKKCIKHEKAKQLFPLNNHIKHLRERFKINFASSERYKKSSIPYMQNLFNQNERKKVELKRSIGL